MPMDEETRNDDVVASTPEPEPEPAHEREAEASVHVDTNALVLTCISLLASKAWEAMGLVPDPATKRIERVLSDAQLAIDAAAALADLVRATLGDAERRELDTLLMNLRLNFVEQRAKG